MQEKVDPGLSILYHCSRNLEKCFQKPGPPAPTLCSERPQHPGFLSDLIPRCCEVPSAAHRASGGSFTFHQLKVFPYPLEIISLTLGGFSRVLFIFIYVGNFQGTSL